MITEKWKISAVQRVNFTARDGKVYDHAKVWYSYYKHPNEDTYNNYLNGWIPAKYPVRVSVEDYETIVDNLNAAEIMLVEYEPAGRFNSFKRVIPNFEAESLIDND